MNDSNIAQIIRDSVEQADVDTLKEAIILLKEYEEDMVKLEGLVMNSNMKNHYYKQACRARDAIEKAKELILRQEEA